MELVMSLTLPKQEKSHKIPTYQSKNSGELDVFEASRYFSSASEVFINKNNSTFAQKITKSGRSSLDILSMERISIHGMEKETREKKKKCRQPNSPGAKIASLLSSLFTQTSSKIKKSKSSIKDEDESPSGRRKRRSSISSFLTGSNSNYSSAISGFSTPTPYADTPTKVYKDISMHDKSTALQNDVHGDKRNEYYTWLDEKLKCSNGISEEYKKFCNGSEEREFRKFNEVGDGADSDSSSDLFELKPTDLGHYPSELPVYETTYPYG